MAFGPLFDGRADTERPVKMNAKNPIRLYNRRTRRLEHEKVYGRRAMDVFYGRAWGRWITNGILIRPWVSRFYGRLQNHPCTRKWIAPFIREHGIDMSEISVPPGGFRSFNDFFTRKLRPGARFMEPDPQTLIAPADSRLQVFTVDQDASLKIKGTVLTLTRLLNRARLDGRFRGGICLCFRLAPCDYHRFGYVDDGIQDRVTTIKGSLHSVNPLALRHKPDIHCTNSRQWCRIRSAHFGNLIQIEVGAMMVGSIVQHRPEGGACRRGQEKGLFQFGGSTVLLVLEPGQVVMDRDIEAYSRQGIETLVRYGEAIGRKPRSG
jgi:phosphatidylserine decarboxylase